MVNFFEKNRTVLMGLFFLIVSALVVFKKHMDVPDVGWAYVSTYGIVLSSYGAKSWLKDGGPNGWKTFGLAVFGGALGALMYYNGLFHDWKMYASVVSVGMGVYQAKNIAKGIKFNKAGGHNDVTKGSYEMPANGVSK